MSILLELQNILNATNILVTESSIMHFEVMIENYFYKSIGDLLIENIEHIENLTFNRLQKLPFLTVILQMHFTHFLSYLNLRCATFHYPSLPTPFQEKPNHSGYFLLIKPTSLCL